MNHDLIKTTLGQLLEHLNFVYTNITVSNEEDYVRAEIEAPEPSRIIGWHGETLNSIQQLLKAIIRTKEHLERAPFIILDIDDYRKMQEDKVRSIAQQKADFVRRTGNRIALAPMSPYFRRIVHLHIANTPELQDLSTMSTGEGDYRQVVLRLKEEKLKTGEELAPVIAEDDGLENLDI
ncbi:hypothetical protein COU77_00355 [Candidatus Peregrinibacteria bacterium CG10_big_fil_rev_8_21_14_0_10_49_16]|nr:MAG: hypothetical protein COW95_04360 [Candidatus Peregrinibacteria bacterium CG22_combo_CG10-13_8_21_14_all_49_11]PIR52437.1 MAG: hypothetical protein COU77_00355 [Candidatus Peregrinibacteria bacterium CG10_big_fil_rev_8_21_14_0_10_49_16]